MKSRRSSVGLRSNRVRNRSISVIGKVAFAAGSLMGALSSSAFAQATQFWTPGLPAGNWDLSNTNWVGASWTQNNIAQLTGSDKTIEIEASIQVSGLSSSTAAVFNDANTNGLITFVGSDRFLNAPTTENNVAPPFNFNDGNDLTFNVAIASDAGSPLTINSAVNPDATLLGEDSKPGQIILNADNTGLVGDVVVNAGSLTLGTTGRINSVNAVTVNANLTDTLQTVLNITTSESISDTATLTNNGTVNLNATDADVTTDDETISAYVSTGGTLNGTGNTLAATTYTLNTGSTVNANLGEGTVDATGTVQINGTVGHSSPAVANSILNVNAGTTTLNNVAFSDDVNVDVGSLILTAAGNLSEADTVDITGNGTISTGASDQIADAAVVTVAGTLQLNSNSETTGAVTLKSGVIDATTVGSATLTSGTSFTLESGTVNAVLAGAGIDLTKNTSGNATLNAQNTYTGITIVNSGILSLGNATNTLADTSTVETRGGTLALDNNIDTVNGVSLQSGSITGTGNATAGVLTSLTDIDVRSGSASANLAGTVNLNKTTTGNVTLTGQNAYTGTTTVDGGTLEITGNGTISASNVISIATGATLSTDGGALSQDAIITSAGTGILALSGNETIKGLNGIGSTNLNAATLTIDTDGNATGAVDSSYSGVIADSTGVGSLTKVGAGELELTGANTYTGTTTVTGGVLYVSGPGSLASTDIQVNSSSFAPAILQTDGGLVNAATVNLANTDSEFIICTGDETVDRVTGTGVVRIDDFSGDGGATLDGNTLTISSSGADSTFDGTIVDFRANAAGNLTKSGSNTLTLTGANTYTGTTSVTAGTLALQGTSGSLVISVSSGASLTTNAADLLDNTAAMTNAGTVDIGGDDTIGSYTGTGTLNGTGNTLTAATYTLNAGSEINANLGAGAITVNGNTALNGTSSAATINITAGTLTTGSDYRLLNNVAITNSGVLALGGNEDETPGEVGSITGSGAVQLNSFGIDLKALAGGDISGVISGDDDSNFGVQGAGTQTISGANTYTGNTFVGDLNSGSTLILGGSNQSKSYAVDSGSILTANGTNRISDTASVNVEGTYNVQGDDTIGSLSRDGQVDLGANILTFNGDADSTADENLATFSGVISGTGQLAKIGDDIQVLSGANTYTGSTTINAGTLRIANDNALGGGAGTTTVNSGGSLQLSGGITFAESIDLGGAGQAVTYTGNNTLLTSRGALSNLSGVNTTTQTINIGLASGLATTIAADAGTLTLTGNIVGDVSAPVLTFQAAEGASIVVTSANLGGGITNLTKTGRGSLDLSDLVANNTTGNLFINDGSVIIDAEADLGGSTVVFGASTRGTLVIEAGATETYSTADTNLTLPVGNTFLTSTGNLFVDLRSTQFDFTNKGTIEANSDIAVRLVDFLNFSDGDLVKNGAGALLIDLTPAVPGDPVVLPTLVANQGDIWFENLPGTITVNGLEQQAGSVSGFINLVNTNLIVNQAADGTYDGAINTNGFITVNSNGGGLVLSGNNVGFTGRFTVAGDSGTVTIVQNNVGPDIVLGDAADATKRTLGTGGTNAANTVVEEGGTLILSAGSVNNTAIFDERLQLEGGASLTFDDPVVVNGLTTVLFGTGSIADIGSVSAGQLVADIINGNVVTSQNARVGFNTQPGQVGELEINGDLIGFSQVQFGGVANGIVVVKGENVYSGGTRLNNGARIVVGSDTAFGDTGALVTVAANGNAALNALDASGFSVSNGINLQAGSNLTVGQATGFATIADNADADPTNNTAARNITLSGNIQGSGTLTKGDGTGTLFLPGTNTFTGPLNIRAGTVNVATGSLNTNTIDIDAGSTLVTGGGLSTNASITNDGTLSLVGNDSIGNIAGTGAVGLAANTLTVSSGAGGNLSGVISGTGGLTLTSGTQTISGANTYTGATTVNGGTLTNSGTSASSTISVASLAGFTTTAADLLANTAALTNAGTVTLGGSDTIGSFVNSGTLNGAFTLTATTYALNGGSIVNANLGNGAITVNGLVTLNGTSGTGSLSVVTGTTTLSGASSAGTVSISTGATLNSTATNLFSDTAAFTLANAGTLGFGGDETIGSLSGLGSVSAATLTVTTLNSGATINSTGLVTSGGTFSGNLASGTLTNTANTLNVTGANSSTGAVSVTGGTLALGATGSLASTNVTVGAAGALSSTGGLNNSTTLANAGAVTFTGDETLASYSGAGSLAAAGTDLMVSGVLSSTGTISVEDLTVGTLNGSSAITSTGTVTAAGGTFSGNLISGNLVSTGTLALNAANATAGTISVDSGILTFGAAGSAANVTAVTVASGAGLTTTSAESINNAAALTNSGLITLGGVETVASLTNSGTITGGTLNAATYALNNGSIVNANLGNGAITTNGSVAINGTSGTGSLAVQTGTTTVGSTSGATVVSVANGATLATNATGDLSDTAAVALTGSGALTLGASDTIGNLTGGGSVALAANTLTLSTGTATSSATIGGSGGVTVAGATQTLSGVSTYTGATTVNSGALNLTGSLASTNVTVGATGTLTTAGGLSNDATVTTTGGTFALAGDETIASLTGTGATITLGANTLTLANAAGTYTGAISGAGNLAISAGSQSLGATTFTGDLLVNGGTLSLTGTLADAVDVMVASGGTVNFTVSDTFASLTNSGLVNLGGASVISVGTYTQIDGTLSGTGTLTATTSNLDQIVVNAGTTLAGATVNINGATTVAGTVTAPDINVNAGILTLTNTGTINSATTVDILAGAGLTTGGSQQIANGATVANAGVITLGGTETITNLSGAGRVDAAGQNLNVTGTLSTTGDIVIGALDVVTLNGSSTIASASVTADNGTFAGNINSGSLTKETGGLLTITSAQDYVGATTVSAGTLALTGSLASTNVTVQTGSLLSSTGGLADGTTLTLNGTGALTLTGDETFASIAAGTGAITATGVDVLVTGNLSTGGSIAVDDLTVGGTFTSTSTIASTGVITASVGTLSGAITDGAIVKNGAGLLTLSGTNTATDSVTVNGGTLTLAGTSQFSSLDVNAGLLNVNAASAATVVGVSSGASLTTGAANVLADAAAFTNAGTLTLGGSDTIGSFVNSGTVNGAFTLTAATYALNTGSVINANLGTGTINTSGTVGIFGTTGAAGTINVADGTTTLAGASAATTVNVNGGTLSVTGTINSATSVFIDGDATLITSGAAKIGDNAVITNAGLLTIGGSETVDSITGSGDIVLGSNTLTIDNSVVGSNISGTVQGLGSVQLTGGSLTFSGANTYTGGTLVTGSATLVLAHDGNTLSNTGTLTVGQVISTGNVVLNTNTDTVGPVVLVTGSISGSSNSGAFGDGIQGVLTGTGANYQVQLGSVSASLAGTVGLDKVNNIATVGDDIVTLSGINTYTGDTTITFGTLALAHKDSTLADDNNVTVNGATAVLALAGNTDTVGTVVLANGSITGTGNGTAGVLTASEANFDVRNGSVSATLAGTFGLDKTTADVVTLSGINTFTGATLVSAGTLAINGALDQTAITVSSTGTLNYNATDTVSTLTNSGVVNLANNVVLTVSTLTQSAGTLGAAINTGDSITATTYNLNGGTVNTDLNAGTVNVGGNILLNGSSSAASVNINTGTLTLGASQRLLDTAAVTFDSISVGGLTLGGAATIGSLAGGTDADSVNLSGFNLTIGGNAVGTVDTTSFAGIISNGSLTKTGIDTQVLTGANTYAGTTTVNAGTLTLDGTTASLALVVNGGALNVNAASSATTASVTGGTLITNNGSLLNTIDVTVDGGTFAVTGGSETIDALAGAGGTVTVADGFTLSVGSANGSAAYSGVIGGLGGLTKIGTGTETLSGANTYTGATLVSAGTLTVNGSLAQTDITVASPATLNYDASDTVASLTNSGAVNLANNVVLSATTLTQNAGTLGAAVNTGDSITATTYNLNGGTVHTDLNAGTVNVGGSTLLNGNSLAASVNVNTGTLTLGASQRLLDTTAVSFDTTNTGGLTLGGAETIGSLAGGNSADSVTLGASTLTIGGNGDLTVQSTSFGGVISGAGSLVKSGIDTQVLTGINTYTGNTTVSAGILKVDGSIASSATTVASGAKLMGSGTVGNLVVANGATLAPGSSPGIMNVAGNWTQNGVYQSEIAGTGGAGAVNGHDRTNVTGSTTLGGTSTLQLAKLSGFEASLGQSFRTINSTGGIVGQFGTVVSFFNTGIVLDLSSGTLYGTGLTGLDGAGLGSQNVNLAQLAGLNGNSQALVTALQTDAFVADPDGVQFRSSTNSGAAILALLTNPAGPVAVANLLSPETYAGDTDYSIRSARNYTQTALGSAPQTHIGSFGLFAAYTSAQGGTESSSNQADYDYTTQGGLAGATVNLGQRASLGAFVAIDSGDINSTFRNGDVDGQVLGLFGEYILGEKRDLVLTGSYTHGRYEVDSKRISALGTANATNVDSSVNALSLGLRYDMIVASNYGISPYVSFNYADASTDSFVEAGTADALTVRGIDSTSFQAELGARGYIQVNKAFAFTGGLAVAQELGDSDTDVDASFGAGTPFKVTSEGAGSTEVSANVGARYDVTPRLSFNAGVEVGVVKDGETSSSVFAGGSLKF